MMKELLIAAVFAAGCIPIAHTPVAHATPACEVYSPAQNALCRGSMAQGCAQGVQVDCEFPDGPEVMGPQAPPNDAPSWSNPGNLQACLAAKAMGGDVHGQC
jgi:hypothetical protein